MKYSFAGETRLPPVPTRELLETLMAPDHALCYILSRGRKVLHI